MPITAPINWTQIAAQQATAPIGGIGTYALAVPALANGATLNEPITANSTIAGSDLRYAGGFGFDSTLSAPRRGSFSNAGVHSNAGSSPLSGTWRLMGNLTDTDENDLRRNFGSSLWLRIL